MVEIIKVIPGTFSKKRERGGVERKKSQWECLKLNYDKSFWVGKRETPPFMKLSGTAPLPSAPGCSRGRPERRDAISQSDSPSGRVGSQRIETWLVTDDTRHWGFFFDVVLVVVVKLSNLNKTARKEFPTVCCDWSTEIVLTLHKL